MNAPAQFTPSDRAEKAIAILKQLYPDTACALTYEGEPWKLLVMGRLSAQCTDKRVNLVCQDLFAAFPTAEALAKADLSRIEDMIRPCGLFRTKAADIKEECRLLTQVYGGVLPKDMDTLLTFPGVGRKIANLLRGDIFGLPAIVADTHCIRISARIGLTKEGEKDPLRTEKVLSALIPSAEQADFCHRMVDFGRDVCDARKPNCPSCPMRSFCRKALSDAEPCGI